MLYYHDMPVSLPIQERLLYGSENNQDGDENDTNMGGTVSDLV